MLAIVGYKYCTLSLGKLPNPQPLSKVRPFFGLFKFFGNSDFFLQVNLLELVQLSIGYMLVNI